MELNTLVNDSERILSEQASFHVVFAQPSLQLNIMARLKDTLVHMSDYISLTAETFCRHVVFRSWLHKYCIEFNL